MFGLILEKILGNENYFKELQLLEIHKGIYHTNNRMFKFVALDDQRNIIRARHSFYEKRSSNDSVPSKSETFSRSDLNIMRSKDFPSTINSAYVDRQFVKTRKSEEYYKNYEHDDVPVKDNSSLSSEFPCDITGTGDKKELTNSDIDKLEIRIYKNMSKELQTDESSTDGSKCNMKLFRTAIQEIFDNFNSNMRDFDLYKKKFHEILAKNKENSVCEMEDFIREIIKQIIPSESCVTTESNETNLLTCSGIGTEAANELDSDTFSGDSGDCQLNTPLTVEAYKNDKYLTDTTFDKDSSDMNRSEFKQKIYNIYLLNGNPCIEIKMDGRNLLSEINVRNPQVEVVDPIASAENIKRVAEKKLQLQKYMKGQEKCQSIEKIIPVKFSYAKKNIHSEEFPKDTNENNKSFIFKICNYLCRKLRKNSLG